MRFNILAFTLDVVYVLDSDMVMRKAVIPQ